MQFLFALVRYLSFVSQDQPDLTPHLLYLHIDDWSLHCQFQTEDGTSITNNVWQTHNFPDHTAGCHQHCLWIASKLWWYWHEYWSTKKWKSWHQVKTFMDSTCDKRYILHFYHSQDSPQSNAIHIGHNNPQGSDIKIKQTKPYNTSVHISLNVGSDSKVRTFFFSIHVSSTHVYILERFLLILQTVIFGTEHNSIN